MKEFLDRADGFIKLEEVLRQAQTVKVGNRQSQGALQPHDFPGAQASTSTSAQTSSGETNKARECYVQTLHHKPESDIPVVKERGSKQPKLEEPTISFTEGDVAQRESNNQNSDGPVHLNQHTLSFQCHDRSTSHVQPKGGDIYLPPLPEVPNKARAVVENEETDLPSIQTEDEEQPASEIFLDTCENLEGDPIDEVPSETIATPKFVSWAKEVEKADYHAKAKDV
uniref:Uncharacterized protein n=1 Tax=Cannabis sativa TaxID=3483 RepID=A0A803QHG7_CANSA